MTTMASIAELQNAGVTCDAGEAVAIAQQLIQTLRHGDDACGVEPPYGPPTAATVFLKADGTVGCAGCGTAPAVCEVAIFLDALLPAGSPRIPGALRYTIARGMLDVDVPPFDSLDEFSQALARYERGPRDAAVRRVLERAPVAIAVVHAERRHARQTPTALRRALRDADERLYALQAAARAMPASPPPARPRSMSAVAACLGAGMIVIAAGEGMHRRHAPETPVAAPPPSVAAPIAVATTGSMPDLSMPAAEAPVTSAPPDSSSTAVFKSRRIADSPRVVRPGTRRSETVRTRTKRPRSVAVTPPRTARSSKGVLDRLRLRWLRDAFSNRSDL
jgi:hypothetical protein